MIQTFIFAAYFTSSIAENETTGTAQWGFTIGLAGFAIAVLAPILGSIADVGGPRKPWVYFFAGISIISTSLLWFAEPSLDFLTYSLVLAFFGTVGAELSLIFIMQCYQIFLLQIKLVDGVVGVGVWASQAG